MQVVHVKKFQTLDGTTFYNLEQARAYESSIMHNYSECLRCAGAGWDVELTNGSSFKCIWCNGNGYNRKEG